MDSYRGVKMTLKEVDTKIDEVHNAITHNTQRNIVVAYVEMLQAYATLRLSLVQEKCNLTS